MTDHESRETMVVMETKVRGEVVHLKLPRDVYEAVRKIADTERRSIHNTTRLLIYEALKARTGK